MGFSQRVVNGLTALFRRKGATDQTSQREMNTLGGTPFYSQRQDEIVNRLPFARDLTWFRYQVLTARWAYEVSQEFASAVELIGEDSLGDRTPSILIHPAFDSAEARNEAERAALLGENIATTLTLGRAQALARSLLVTGASVAQLVYNQKYEIIDIVEMPPEAIGRNSNGLNRFEPGQKDAYIQYDWFNGGMQATDARFSEAQMVYGQYKPSDAQRYPLPPIVRVMKNVEGLLSIWDKLPDARLGSLPEKVYITHDSNGQPLDKGQLEKFHQGTKWGRAQRGERYDASEPLTLNGADDAKMLDAGGSYFKAMADLHEAAARVGRAFGVPACFMAELAQTVRIDWGVALDRLYAAQNMFCGRFADQVDRKSVV